MHGCMDCDNLSIVLSRNFFLPQQTMAKSIRAIILVVARNKSFALINKLNAKQAVPQFAANLYDAVLLYSYAARGSGIAV